MCDNRNAAGTIVHVHEQTHWHSKSICIHSCLWYALSLVVQAYPHGVVCVLCRAAECVVCAHPQLPLDICKLLGIAALEDIACEMLDERAPSEPLQYQATIQVRHQACGIVQTLDQSMKCLPRDGSQQKSGIRHGL